MKFILGTKGKMTTVFTEDGQAFAATVINAAPNIVTQIKTQEKDGYRAVQLGAVEVRESRVSKAQLGHAKGKALRHYRELRPTTAHGKKDEQFPEVGSAVDVSAFAVGDKITVSAISKGRGFAGVVKRHGFHGGPRSHGQKHSERSPGSIGGGGGRAGGRVAKGMRMAGQTGNVRVKVQNLEVLKVYPEQNLIVVKGSVPGAKGSFVIVDK